MQKGILFDTVGMGYHVERALLCIRQLLLLTTLLVVAGCSSSINLNPLRWSAPQAAPFKSSGYSSTFDRTSNGNVFFAWADGDDERVDVEVSWVTRDLRESPVYRVASFNKGIVKDLTASANASGASVVTWVGRENGHVLVMGVRLSREFGMTRFGTGPINEPITGLETSINQSGDTFVVWCLENNKFGLVYCPEDNVCIEVDEFSVDKSVWVNEHRVAQIKNGFVLVWSERRSSGDTLYSRVFRDGAFGPVIQLTDEIASVTSMLPELVRTIPGGVVVAWVDHSGKIFVRRFNSKDGWQSAEQVHDAEKEVNTLLLQADGNGVLHILWHEDYYNKPQIWVSRGEQDRSWSPAIGLDETKLPHHAYGAELGVHEDGRAVSLWFQANPSLETNELWGSTTIVNGKWESPQKLPLPAIQDATLNYEISLRQVEGNAVWLDVVEDSWVYWLD